MTEPSERTLEALRAPLKEVAIRKIWRGVDQRRNTRPLGWFGALAWGLVGAAASAGAIGALQFGAGDGPVRMPNGEPLKALQAPKEGARLAIDLSDGSSIALDPGTEIATLTNGDKEVAIVVNRGHATFDVRPNGPRRWILTCDGVIVDVVGTRFELECGMDRTRVAVQRGLVHVRGPGVPGDSQDLGPAETFLAPRVVDDVPPSAPPSAAPPSAAPAPRVPTSESDADAAAPVGLSASPPASTRALPMGWRALAAERRYPEAYRSLGPRGIEEAATSADVADLFALADVARLSGHHAEAELALVAIVRRHPHDARASTAAFTLGRMYLGPMGRTRDGAQMLSRALSLGLPAALREDALVRLVEAYGRAGDVEEARRAAERYVREYPTGRHRATVSPWLADAAEPGTAP
jgi:transmembrane sensor